jgi:phage replication initiation protein
MTSPKTSIDWLRFRTQADPMEGLEALQGLYGELGGVVGLDDFRRGSDGFLTAATVNLSGMTLGRVDYGGESQRGWVRWNLTGKGCENVRDWDAIEAIEALPKAEVRRLDIALTTWHGQVGHDDVVSGHAAGRFRTSGRPPAMQTIMSTDPRAGRTCSVGKRGSDKFFRGYEKGFELAAKWPMGDLTHIDGCPVEGIYRCEVELQSESRPIPWETIERRDQYFAGAYPFCADVLPGVEADILSGRRERAPQFDLAAALANVRVQYGATLYTALAAYQGDMTAVWDLIVGDHHNQDLVAAGVLLVDHY